MQVSPRIEIRRHSAALPWTYEALDQRQRVIGAEVDRGGPGALLLSEVAPVITMGRRATPSELRLPAQSLRELGVGIYPTDRGGLATWHGPGQWVLFAVDRLDSLTGDAKGVRRAVDALLDVALDAGRRFDSSAEIRTGCELGVWTRRGKFAAVGVQVRERKLFHGLSVNGFATPLSFTGLRPCGLDAPVDFLLRDVSEKEKDSEFESLGRLLLERAGAAFWKSKAREEAAAASVWH